MDLARYDNRHYYAGAGIIRRTLWYVCNAIIFDSWLMPLSTVKRSLLRMFGARIGERVIIKPRVNIKYPWNLIVGANTWIGEGVWLDNLAVVTIGKNVCISQGAYFLTGNHDYRDEAFKLVTRSISVEDSAWIGAFAIICPGVNIREESVLSVRSVASTDTEAGWVYKGAPATKVKLRNPLKMRLTG